MNKFVIANGIERQVVLYWYQQGGGRVVTNEYLGRVHLVLDAIKTNRTDAALIRVIVPAADESESALDASTNEAVAFLRASYPELMRFAQASCEESVVMQQIPLSRPDITDADIDAVVNVLRTPHLSLVRRCRISRLRYAATRARNT